MSAKIKHIAIISDQYALEGRFYEAVFGMKAAADKRPERAVTVCLRSAMRNLWRATSATARFPSLGLAIFIVSKFR